MTAVFSFIANMWSYTINHKWSKDILRANILFIRQIAINNLNKFNDAD